MWCLLTGVALAADPLSYLHESRTGAEGLSADVRAGEAMADRAIAERALAALTALQAGREPEIKPFLVSDTLCEIVPAKDRKACAAKMAESYAQDLAAAKASVPNGFHSTPWIQVHQNAPAKDLITVFVFGAKAPAEQTGLAALEATPRDEVWGSLWIVAEGKAYLAFPRAAEKE